MAGSVRVFCFVPLYQWQAHSTGVIGGLVLIASPAVFVIACASVFSKPRMGYALGALAGLISTIAVLWPEISQPWWNSWIVLNVPDQLSREYGSLRMQSTLLIVSVALTSFIAVYSAIRLCPANWTIRNQSVRDLLWPCFFGSAIVLVSWFVYCATPYRTPGFVDKVQPEIKLLHVQKRGLQFDETCITVYKDHAFYLSRTQRRLFQYRFKSTSSSGVLPSGSMLHVQDFLRALEVEHPYTSRPKALRKWSAEGWYVVGSRTKIFSTEDGSAPPSDVVELFNELAKQPTAHHLGTYSQKDVCLGFCYDVRAALGDVFASDRCKADENGRYVCE